MKNINKQNITKLYEVQINAYRELIPCIREVIAVAEKFDGKILNVKLSNALKDLDTLAHYRIGKDQYGQQESYVNIQLKQRYYSNNPDSKGYSSVSYDFVSDKTVYLSVDDKRINAGKTIESLNKCIEGMESAIVKLENNLANIDKIIAEYGELYERIRIFNDDLDSISRRTLRFEGTFI